MLFVTISRLKKICRGRDGVELIISNPCFEVWLLDHKRTCPQSCTQTAMVEKLAIAEGVTEGNRGNLFVLRFWIKRIS